MAKRRPDRAAAWLLQQEGEEDPGQMMTALHEAVRVGNFQYVRKQTGTRTLCKAYLQGERGALTWFILDKVNDRIVKVLTEEEAKSLS